MDWARAIEINQAALDRIVTALFAMVGFTIGSTLEKPPRAVHLAVLRILRPVESALRRLIIIAARGLVLKPSAAPARPMPKGLAIAGGGAGRVSFQLFDSRTRFTFGLRKRRSAKVGPRIWSLDDPHLVPSLLRYQPPPPVPEPKPDTSHLRFGGRLAAIKSALDDLPRQAIRYLRWQARRDAMPNPEFKDPLRPGQPPGHRKEPAEEIDFVLKECHWLAREALSPNTS